MPQPFDSTVVRAWIAFALEAVGEACEEIDAINVFPVADGDTGTNLRRTLEAAARALEAEWDASDPAAPALRALSRGALLGACGNSGTILAQLLRGMAETYGATDGAEGSKAADAGEVPGAGRLLAEALTRAADSAYAAVAHPVEGTMLSVARAAAEAARTAGEQDADAEAVARAAHERSHEALSETTGQLDVLRRAGVVDAGGSGLVAVLGALADALADPEQGEVSRRRRAYTGPNTTVGSGTSSGAPVPPDGGGGAYEVMYLLDADDAAVTGLRERLDGLGDSLVVGGGDGLWSVHVHVDDAGAAVEAGVGAGRPHRIRITHLTAGEAGEPCAPEHADAGGTARHGRAVVAVVHGDGLAGLCEDAGATVVRAKEALGSPDGEPLAAAVRATGAAEVVLLPNDIDLHAAASRAADGTRAEEPELRVSVVPTRAAVQGISALAVHDPERRFDDDVVAMTTAAGATRYGEVTVADRPFWTMAGVCEAGDVLGLVEDDVVVIGSDVAEAAADVLERMLAAGGELVTLIVGEHAPQGLTDRLEEQVRGGHLAVDTVVYEGRQHSSLLLIGVE
ncbi:DAK2 domain-containing protein [Streptomyces bathyalis]|uniref:DAK2 domain-containing protein n=1 Tax=Streptomyces bathyalis TaxID=2710756 RepID=A0A7T1T4R1_9ACTN|nr:DAK2 domain-containing protein [Streptomyces bathyalis]QPP06364.1 DAK2 domain-containing protein [Streptomyces bathyalis]